MISVAFSSAFKRSLSKAIRKKPSRRAAFEAALTLFIADPFARSLKTHKLAGPLKDHWSFTVEYDLRVIFRFVESEKVVFEAIGSHDEVY